MSVAGLAAAGGIASAASSLLDTGVNAGLTVWSNKKNEKLMRESWAREDNAVQRRVADLKAAGLSPVLAAGSAAASSGPIQVKAPKIDTSAAIQNALSTASAVKALKNMDLQNENLKKQGELLDLNSIYYGYPDWAIAGIRMFGLEEFKDMLRSVGGNLFGLFGNSGASTGSSSSKGIGVPYTAPKLPTGLKVSNSSVKGFESVSKSNDAAKSALDLAGLDTSKPKVESDAKSFGVSDDFAKSARDLVDIMIKDNMASTDNLDRLAYSLSVRYNYKFEDVRKYITDLVREARKH